MVERGVTPGRVGVAYTVDGPRDAPALVLSNSLGTTTAMWDGIAQRFAQYFRVVRYDHRGHGGSPTPPGPYSIDDLGQDVLNLADALALDKFAFCGTSLGGAVGIWAASREPERVLSLVLAAAAPSFGSPESYRERAQTVRARGTNAISDALIGRWFTEAFRAARPDVVADIVGGLGRCDAEGYALCCEALADMDLHDRLEQISAPTLVVGGANDPVVPAGVSLAVSEAIAGSTLVVMAGAHLVPVERPLAFTDEALAHLRDAPFRRGMAARRQVLGDEHVERALGRVTPFSEPFQEFITRYAWGEIWSRPGLDRRTRSAITIAMLAATGRADELDFHIPAALRNGLREEEISEILLQVAIYGGVPAANEAFAAAQRALDASRRGDDGETGQ
jgi:3-oxoadipate enol-lactonase / 4-carboxymuconolactone decarboxylase